MTHNDFNALLERRLALTKSVLATKSEEYATSDRLHNFKVSGELKRESPAQALLGMLVKHWVSIMDLVQTPGSEARIDEKIGDAVNYSCLLEAVLKEVPME